MNSFKYIILIISHIILLAISAGCGKQNAIREKLEYVNKMTETNPDAALACLDSMRNEEMSEADRIFYDFLSIKGSDKAYIDHKSDSLFLNVLNYYSKHSRDKLYPEVLYYGGRVYSDLGDFPTALSFFQDALDIIPDKKEYLIIRKDAISKIGNMLDMMGFYNEAILYVEDLARIDEELNDSVQLVQDIKQLGSIFIKSKEYDKAETAFKKARQIAHNLSKKEVAVQDANLAYTKFLKNNQDSALYLIRKALSELDSTDRNDALIYAPAIFLKSNILDSAIMYARQLLKSEEFWNRRIGYKILLSPELNGIVQFDSVIGYAFDSMADIGSYVDDTTQRGAIVQESYYNYERHKKEIIMTETRNYYLIWGIIGAIIIATLSGTYVYSMKCRSKSQLLQLHEAVEIVEILQKEISKSQKKDIPQESGNRADNTNMNANNDTITKNNSENDMPYDTHTDSHVNNYNSIRDTTITGQELRNRLRDKIQDLLQDCNKTEDISPLILESEAYRNLLQYISDRKIISDSNPLWDDLENIVLKSSPDFKNRLNILTGGNLKRSDLLISILIKCGISSTNMAILIGRTKATITYRRKCIGKRILDQNADLEIIDKIIRLL